MFRNLLLAALLLLSALPATAASPVKARPLSGIGLLIIRTETAGGMGEPRRLIIYREPGIERVADLAVNRLPDLAPVLAPEEGRTYAIVTSVRPGWFRIVYDESERHGWVEKSRMVAVERWEQFLEGRRITMLPGIRKDYYLVRGEASLTAEPLENVSRESVLTIVKVEGDWVKVRISNARGGWLRWRDDNSRLLVSVKLPILP